MRRKEIDDAAAHRELTRVFNDCDPGITRGGEFLNQHVAIEGLPDLKFRRVRAKSFARRDSREQSAPRRDDDRRVMAMVGRSEQPI